MSLHPEDVQKLQWLYDVVRGIDGDNVRWSGNSLYIGSGGGGGDSPGTDWRPRQFRVKSEENDYLVCVPYNDRKGAAGEKEYKVAKIPSSRGGDTLKAVTPPYVADETIIWAAPFRDNGAVDGDDAPIALMELNGAGSTSSFWAKITAAASVGDNRWKYDWTEQQRTTSGWQDLPGGRTHTSTGKHAYNATEANNGATGRQGNGIDVDSDIMTDNTDLEIQAASQNPVVRMYEEVDSDGVLAYSFEYVNAVDGDCA